MSDREAMKLALEALEKSVSAMRGLYGGWRCTTALKESDKAIVALRQALEQPDAIEAAVLTEREACAKVCESLRPSKPEYDQRFYDGCTASSAAIRKRTKS